MSRARYYSAIACALVAAMFSSRTAAALDSVEGCNSMVPIRAEMVKVTVALTPNGSLIARHVVIAAFLIPMLDAWPPLPDEQLGYRGIALFVFTNAVVLASLIWLTARFLRRGDEARRRAVEALEDEHRLLRTLIDNLPAYIYVKDTARRFVINNLAHVRVLGAQTQEQVLGKRDDEIFAPDLAARYRADEEAVIHTGIPLIDKEDPVITPWGEQRWCTSTKVPLRNAQGQIVGLVGITYDITALKNAEDQLQAQNHHLEITNTALGAANQQLEATNRELQRAQLTLVQSEKLAGLGQMVAGVAHEINNPLSFVTNDLVVLQRDLAHMVRVLELYREAEMIDGERRLESVKTARTLSERIDLDYVIANLPGTLSRSGDGLRRIKQIVEDLREFAQLDQSSHQEADLNVGIGSTLNIVRGHAKKKQVTIETDLGPLPTLLCQPAKINQVIMNLVLNAIDASPEGATVMVRSTAAQGDVQLQVIDHGTGIAGAIRERIFDPFFTTKPIGQGTGLGLSISYGIVKDHGGSIEVESEPGRGTTFTIRLPAPADGKE